LDKPTADLSTTGYGGLSNDNKWNSFADFDSYAVASAAPAQPSSIWLAGGSRAAIEAVLPSKPTKKSRFEEAYLAALWKNNERMI
jgi:hypothetical protein